MEEQTKMEEVGQSTNIFKFEKVDDEIEGIYQGTTTGQFGEDFVIKAPSGELFKIFGCAVLRTKFKEVKEGDYVRVVYVGVQPSISKAGFNYKDFKVFRVNAQ